MKEQLKQFAFFAIVAIAFTSCLQYKEVTYSGVKDVAIQSFENNELKLKITVKVNNPNSYKIRLTKGKFNIKSDDIELGSFDLSEKTVIPAETLGDVDVFVSTKFKSLFSPKLLGLMAKVKSNQIPITVEGYVIAKAKIFSKKVKFNKSENISL